MQKSPGCECVVAISIQQSPVCGCSKTHIRPIACSFQLANLLLSGLHCTQCIQPFCHANPTEHYASTNNNLGQSSYSDHLNPKLLLENTISHLMVWLDTLEGNGWVCMWLVGWNQHEAESSVCAFGWQVVISVQWSPMSPQSIQPYHELSSTIFCPQEVGPC